MNLWSVFWCWQSLVITLAIYALTEGMRRFVQSLWKGWRKSRFYTEFVLWAAPVGNGAFFGLLSTFPWQVELATRSARVTYAVVLGLFCSVVYSRIKKLVETSEGPTLGP
jgi:hypothetical protein